MKIAVSEPKIYQKRKGSLPLWKVVEDVGIGPLLIVPGDACYHYTTSSICAAGGYIATIKHVSTP